MESVYGVQLLDDLHAYFPDILYEPERFESVQDLLGYIQEQAQEHFNLYSRGRRLHAASRASPAAGSAAVTGAAPSHAGVAAAAPIPATATPIPAAAVASPAAAAAAPGATAPSVRSFLRTGTGAGVAASTMPAPFTMQTTPLYTSFYQSSRGLPATPPPSALSSLLFNFEMEREDPGTQLLSNILGLAFMGNGNGNGSRGLAANFMDPVVVRPTQDQIAAATDVIVLEEPLETNCAICQDRMEAQNPTRKIRACGHSFHTECIDTWFERSVSCPVCRHDIRDGTATATGSATATVAANANANENEEEEGEFLSDVD